MASTSGMGRTLRKRTISSNSMQGGVTGTRRGSNGHPPPEESRAAARELMLFGFLSLLLTVTKEPISKICIPKSSSETFLSCNYNKSLDENVFEEPSCLNKGKVSLISGDGVNQLQILIFILALYHVFSCVLTFSFGHLKMRSWKSWEEETRTLEYQFSNDPRRFRLTHQTSFAQRHLKFWSDHRLLRWPVCFLRQFYGSVSKTDYFTLRHGFLTAHFAEGSSFDFRMFLRRVLDEDLQVVVGTRILQPFLASFPSSSVGTKLQLIITKMCLESRDSASVVCGTLLVKPHDKFFWFSRPQLVLHLLHFILFQNSFQLAFFTWTWIKFGMRSCFHEETNNIVIRLVAGSLVHVLCGYVTLPLYALVTQMGSSMKKEVFTPTVIEGLKSWHNDAKGNKDGRKNNLKKLSPSHRVDNALCDNQELETVQIDNSSPQGTGYTQNPSAGHTAVEIMEEEVAYEKT
ncbi:MLO-like protein 2 [Papaver somniferum]|uniref:MLO-like protein 2 n=1 Tax=Papaver somniferum TaxID=3469 RepID=UPI000E703573|nr:MLO-like protein 2 [Papaver somniferum]